MGTLLNLIWRAVCVFWVALRYVVVGLVIAGAVVAVPYVLAMILLWLRGHW